ncbi:uncharacterized protein BYT42DRAFT_566445 [Radiomyces spectabilis]|uniref:uncharacterized protein n=1 Tax=Radiomyces spectabilis TaxID=64574 RepID=UPI00221E4982|nr:uncharacterized protein BYT42DRAFT_566445 [Radiomyces spectabilis]KAI8381414.1 hypothetical protein BYT42DRAFT_566445 [Radiomyces spectabilis]
MLNEKMVTNSSSAHPFFPLLSLFLLIVYKMHVIILMLTAIMGFIGSPCKVAAYGVYQQDLQQQPFAAWTQTVDPTFITPYSEQWVHMLESIFNAWGTHNATDKEEHCLHKLPEFTCSPMLWDDAIKHRDARHLRPQDIKSIVALGDSITAGFGMLSGRPPFASLWEYRGKAFSAGGDPGEYTLANFLSTYTDDIRGAPVGVTWPLSRGKGLNEAITGAKYQELEHEVNRLVRIYRSSEYSALKQEWKLVTLFIGANNVCLLCTPPVTKLPDVADVDVLEQSVRRVLERLRTDIGKSFVNLVGLFNVSSVFEASRGDPYCEYLFDTTHMFICSCIQDDDNQRQAADHVVYEYNRRLEKIALEYAELNDPGFAVAYQPGFAAFPVSKYKQSYFSGVDCFHPNQCANRVMAIVLWNNMFSTPEEKLIPYDVENLTIKCPDSHRPYLQ